MIDSTRKTNMSAPTRAAGLIIFRRLKAEIEFLLLQTSFGEHHWTPPKGHVDPGESEKVTALRETEEEAGFKEEHLSIIRDFERTLEYQVNDKPKTVVYWLAELLNPQTDVKLSHEHQDFKWVDLAQACVLAQYEDMQALLKEASDFVKSA